jgi:hypothetical protein
VTATPSFVTKVERDALLERHRAARAVYNRAMDEHVASLNEPDEIGIDESSDAYVDTLAYRRARAAYAEMVAIEEEYVRRLPRMVMAPCPHCAKPLHRTFDPFGVEGFWWRGGAPPDEAPACPHFCVLLGAVNLRGRRPRPDFDVHPGPGAPFVIPRLLGVDGMIAVVSEIPLEDGTTAYPIAYFAPRRPPVQGLAASWARTSFVYTTQLGEHAWRRAHEPSGAAGDDTWDFALDRWLASRRLRWCGPGTDRTTLSQAAPDRCPFRDVDGPRGPQAIYGGWDSA